MNNIGNSAVHLTFAQILTITISLATSMLLSRFRTITEYGTYSQLTLSISIVVSLFSLGIPNSINYFLARAETPTERNEFLSVYYTLSTFLSVTMGVLLVTASPLIEEYFHNEMISTFSYFLAIIPWTTVTISSISNILVVYGKTKKLMLINVVTSLLTLFSVIFIEILNLTFRDYISAIIMSRVLISIWIYFIVNQLEARLRFEFNWSFVKKILVYSIPIGLASLVGTVNVTIDKLMIGRVMETDSLAYYTNAGKELPFTIIATSLTAVLLPHMVKLMKQKKQKEAVELWGYSIRISYIIICFFVTALVVFAPQIMTLLYSEKYLPGVQVFRVYSVVLLLRTTYFGLVLNSTGNTKIIFWCSSITLLINIFLNYILYLFIGFIGPAVATFISILLTNLFQLIVSAKTIHIGFADIFPWKKMGIITLVNVSWGICAYLLIQLFSIKTTIKDIVISGLIGCIIAGVYFMIMRRDIIHTLRKLYSVKV